MITAAPSHDTVVIERLLLELPTRMDRLLDTGTSAVPAGILSDSRAFTADRAAYRERIIKNLESFLASDAGPAPTR